MDMCIVQQVVLIGMKRKKPEINLLPVTKFTYPYLEIISSFALQKIPLTIIPWLLTDQSRLTISVGTMSNVLRKDILIKKVILNLLNRRNRKAPFWGLSERLRIYF